MKLPDAEIVVDVDLTNPGQFFACCGLFELVDRRWPGALAWFDDHAFLIHANGASSEHAILQIAELLVAVELHAVDAPNVKTKERAVCMGDPFCMQLDWWLNRDGSTNPLFKTWAANATSLQMLSKWQPALKECLSEIQASPWRLLMASTLIQGSYGFDSEMGWTGLSVGFSLNEHKNTKKSALRPATEILGAVGLQRFLPSRHPDGSTFTFHPWVQALEIQTAAPTSQGLVPLAIPSCFTSPFVRRGSFKGFGTAIQSGDAM